MASRKAYLVRNLEDVEAYFPDDGDSLTWVSASGKWMPVVGGGGVTTFVGLTDTPANYTAASGYFVRVNDTEDALIFDTVSAEANIAIQKDDVEVVATVTALNFEGRDIVDVADEGGGKATVTISGGATILNELDDVTIQTLAANQLLYYNTVSGWINDLVPISYLDDVTITDPQDHQFLMYDSATGQWINEAVLGADTLFLHEEASTVVGGYEQLLTTPADDAENVEQIIITAASGIHLIDSFVTEDTIGRTILQGGAWHTVMFAKVSSTAGSVSNLVIRGYLRTDGGVETLLGELTTDALTTSIEEHENDFVLSDIICNADDRIVIKVYGQTTSVTARTISFYYEGNEHYSHVHTPLSFGTTQSLALDDLTDVNAPSPNDGDALTWDDDTSKWIPVAVSGGSGASAFTDLSDVPASYSGEAGKLVAVNDAEDALEFVPSGVYPTAFLGLTDTPSSFATFSGYAVQVNAAENALEFVAPSAGGATSMMTVVNTNWDDTQDAHTTDNTWEYITLCSGIITTEEDNGIIRCDWNGVIKYDTSNWEYYYLRFQLDTPDGTVYSPTMTHQFNSGANTTKYNIESIMFVWSGMPAGDYTMRPQVILTSNMDCSFYARVGSIRGDWPVSGGGGGGGGATEFTALSDTPSDYSGQAGLLTRVNAGEDALEFVPSGTYPTQFLGLADTPGSFSGESGKVAAVNAGEDALEFITVAGGVSDFVDLDDTPANYTAASGLGVRVNDDEDALIFEAIVGDFLDLSDSPASYSGEGGKSVSVKDDETGLEFTTGGGGGGGCLAAFRAQITGNWDVGATNVWVKVPFDSEDFDTSTYYDPTTNYRWTPPAGICHISVISEWTNVNTSNVRIGIYKNGTIIAQGMINRYNQSVSADIWDECNGTDYYEVYGFRGSFSGADIVDSEGTKFSGAVFTAP